MIFIRRPVLYVFVVLVILFSIYRSRYGDADDSRYYILDSLFDDSHTKLEGSVTGTADYYETKEKTYAIYLKNATAHLKNISEQYQFNHLIVYYEKKPDFQSGNQIVVTGSLYSFEAPSNPGQFNQKAYYKENNIYYKMLAKDIKITDNHYNVFCTALDSIRQKLLTVYKYTLPEKESGIVSAMILGEKSLLDMDIRRLYRESGISHLLAISGLHISIMGMGLYKLLQLMGASKKAAILPVTIFLVCYGQMTHFSISTSRAVLMMVLFLLAGTFERSYDMVSAACISAIIILLQKPFALTSCSFLLSFGAVCGIAIIIPILNRCIFGEEEKQGERERKRMRKWQEKKSKIQNPVIKKIIEWKFYIWNCAVETFVAGISVEIVILPIIMYYFYEIPVYSVFVNILVIPLSGSLVVLSVVGGLAGMIHIMAGKIVLGSVYFLLQFYEKVCLTAERLPYHSVITGSPKMWQIILYYVILVMIILIFKFRTGENRLSEAVSISFGIILWGMSFGVLVSGRRYDGLMVTFLDVGQGDCIFFRDDTGKTCLIDGGSSSVNNVGTYRILPFLKYYGISQVDYVFMTHSDKDHVSGLVELIQDNGKSGVFIGNFVMPNISEEVIEKEESNELSYNELYQLAISQDICVIKMKSFDMIRYGNVTLCCLNPNSHTSYSSANAYSTVLFLAYKNSSYLFTGDVEKEGENTLIQNFNRIFKRPIKMNVLKVAHHGSKNSTSAEFLELFSPECSVISAGKNNRYGHPHKELMERLEKKKSHIVVTAKEGAITVYDSGIERYIEVYR